MWWNYFAKAERRIFTYRISANIFRGNYSFLNLTLCNVTFGHSTYSCGNYLRAETIRGYTVNNMASSGFDDCIKTVYFLSGNIGFLWKADVTLCLVRPRSGKFSWENTMILEAPSQLVESGTFLWLNLSEAPSRKVQPWVFSLIWFSHRILLHCSH